MTDRQKIVLAAMSPACTESYTPVQIQKLMFLIDREVGTKIPGGPFFGFVPYNYGPFDKSVYADLEALELSGHVELVDRGRIKSFRLTPVGHSEGTSALAALPQVARDYVKAASTFVRSLSFSALVQAIYKAYPDMKVNSIFQH